MYTINKFSFAIIQLLLLIDSTNQSKSKQATIAFKAIGNTIKNPTIKTIAKTLKNSISIFNQKKSNIKNIASGLEQVGGKYLRSRYNLGSKFVQNLGKQGIYKYKAPKLLAESKKNILARSADYIRGKDFESLFNMISKSKPQTPFLFAGGLTKLNLLFADSDYDHNKANHLVYEQQEPWDIEKKNLARSEYKIVLTPWAMRHFNPKEINTDSIRSMSHEEFENTINGWYHQSCFEEESFAPFCKNLIFENITDAIQTYTKITDDNKHLIQTGYQARSEKELPVLTRWFPVSKMKTMSAKYQNIIMYTKEQIQLENEAMGTEDPNKHINYDYGIISIKDQEVGYVQPMRPHSMVRNALGLKQGGSGVEIDRKKYMESVEFWKDYVKIRGENQPITLPKCTIDVRGIDYVYNGSGIFTEDKYDTKPYERNYTTAIYRDSSD